MKQLSKIEVINILTNVREKKLLLTVFLSHYSINKYLFNKLEINKSSFIGDLKEMDIVSIEFNEFLNYYLITLKNETGSFDTISFEIV